MFINKNYTYALVGASENPKKYGNIILNDFNDNGYHIIPVNPNDEDGSIAGLKAYKTVLEIEESVDVVIFVLPPDLVIMVLTNSFKKGVKKVWFQPGTESEKAIRFCEENGIEHNEPGTCILMERRNRERQMK